MYLTVQLFNWKEYTGKILIIVVWLDVVSFSDWHEPYREYKEQHRVWVIQIWEACNTDSNDCVCRHPQRGSINHKKFNFLNITATQMQLHVILPEQRGNTNQKRTSLIHLCLHICVCVCVELYVDHSYRSLPLQRFTFDCTCDCLFGWLISKTMNIMQLIHCSLFSLTKWIHEDCSSCKTCGQPADPCNIQIKISFLSLLEFKNKISDHFCLLLNHNQYRDIQIEACLF